MIARLFSACTGTRTLWLLFGAVLVMTLAFRLLAGVWDLTYLDAISDADTARAVVASMTAGQKQAHAWITATLDVAYPLAYGALFGGLARRWLPRFPWLLLAAALVVPVDLLEGVVQVAALTGLADWLGAKALLTPLKFALFFAALAIAMSGLLVAGWRRLRSS